MPRKSDSTSKRHGPLPPAARIADHRARLASSGRRRVEVVVPESDVELIRDLAERLRAEPAESAAVRAAVASAMAPAVARTGMELVALLRTAPLDGPTLDLERDRSPPRAVDLS
jgi:hypothetical protein